MPSVQCACRAQRLVAHCTQLSTALIVTDLFRVGLKRSCLVTLSHQIKRFLRRWALSSPLPPLLSLTLPHPPPPLPLTCLVASYAPNMAALPGTSRSSVGTSPLNSAPAPPSFLMTWRATSMGPLYCTGDTRALPDAAPASAASAPACTWGARGGTGEGGGGVSMGERGGGGRWWERADVIIFFHTFIAAWAVTVPRWGGGVWGSVGGCGEAGGGNGNNLGHYVSEGL